VGLQSPQTFMIVFGVLGRAFDLGFDAHAELFRSAWFVGRPPPSSQ
jgi:hypothetical protein